MPMGEKHKGLVVCECGTNLVSVFAQVKYEGEFSSSLRKLNGFAYCQKCNKVFKIIVNEV